MVIFEKVWQYCIGYTGPDPGFKNTSANLQTATTTTQKIKYYILFNSPVLRVGDGHGVCLQGLHRLLQVSLPTL